VMPLKLAKLPQGARREADLRGALKNADPIAPEKPGAAASAAPKPAVAPSVATTDIGSAEDEQLSQAADVLRGLALVSGRTG
jgi:hypothetical protein